MSGPRSGAVVRISLFLPAGGMQFRGARPSRLPGKGRIPRGRGGMPGLLGAARVGEGAAVFGSGPVTVPHG